MLYSPFTACIVALKSKYFVQSVTLLPSRGVMSQPLAVRLSGITLPNNAKFKCCAEAVNFACH